MHDNPNAVLAGEFGQARQVEPELFSIPLDNLAHMDNSLLPNYSNTMTAQPAEVEQGSVHLFAALPPLGAAHL